MFSLGIGSSGGNFSLGLGEQYGAGAAAPTPSPSPPGAIVYGGGYRVDDDAFRRKKRRQRDDLPYSSDPELQEARRELRKLAFHLHPDRATALDDKARAEYEELLRLATIEYHAQVERVKKRKRKSVAFAALREQLRTVTARLEQLELELVALRAAHATLKAEVAELRGVAPKVIVEKRWAWPLFIGVLIGALATLIAGAWRTRRKPARKRKRTSAQGAQAKRKNRSRPPRPRSRPQRQSSAKAAKRPRRGARGRSTG